MLGEWKDKNIGLVIKREKIIEIDLCMTPILGLVDKNFSVLQKNRNNIGVSFCVCVCIERYLFQDIDLHDFGGWLLQNLQGRLEARYPGKSQCCNSNAEFPLAQRR